MKKYVVAIIACFAFGFAGKAQINAHAIGIRGLLGNYGAGGEISYQNGLNDFNRFEFDLGWRRRGGNGFSHVALTGIYQWVWNIEGGLNWFVGAGAQIGLTSDKSSTITNNGMTVGVGGQIGIEYDFNSLGAPIQLGLDTRPMWGLIGATSGIGYGGALSFRFTF